MVMHALISAFIGLALLMVLVADGADPIHLFLAWVIFIFVKWMDEKQKEKL